jgi:glycosyltransferase 2 family protein
MNIKIFINTTISVIISTLCCIIFINSLDYNFNISEVIQSISIQWIYLLIACLLIIFSVLLRSLRWNLLFQNNNNITKYLFRAQFISYFINNISPLRIGDLAKSYIVAKNTNNKTSYIFGSIIMERFSDVIMVLLLLFILIINYGLDYFNLSLSFSLLVYLPLFLLFSFIFFKSKIFFPTKIQNIIIDIWDGFTAIKISNLYIIIIYSFMIWAIYLLNVYLIQLIFPEISLSLLECLFILVISSLIQMIPIGFGSIGIFHIGLQGALIELNIDNYNSFIFVAHLYSYIIYTIIGAYYFMHEKKLTIKNLYDKIVNI